MARWPEGLVIVGDAACAFNPVYAQGMTTAALGAMTLDECLRARRRAHGIAAIGRRFQRRLARATTTPWVLATSEDCRYDGVEGGARDAVTRLMHRYMDRVIERTTESADVRRALLEVFHMLRPPSALFRPAVLARVLRPAAGAVAGAAAGATGAVGDAAAPAAGG
jgi:2-polyprenyl-6-methoxyphenol hydroxylase-like FAD-dependent oxidoreductase